MTIKKWITAALLLMALNGCTRRLPPPVASTTIPVFTPTVAQPGPIVPATPTLAPATTATLQAPSAQQPFSVTLPIPQTAGEAQTAEVNGLLYLPVDYGRDAQRRWPLIVFLHGSGERGYDPQHLTSIGLPQILQDRSDIPFVVVSPQLPPGEWWNDKGEMLDALIDWIKEQYTIDSRRIYLTGFSLGGFGTWALGLRSPDRFAALVPVAGGWEFDSEAVPSNICNLATKRIWVFHGAQDEAVKPEQSEVLVKALRACGSDVRYTVIPQATHAASGLLPYRESELYDWLLQQALPEKVPVAATAEATAADAGVPIGSATPEVINTPLPGDGSLKPIGQHAYSIALDVVGAKGITHTTTISYLLYLPGAYGQDPQQQWPLVLFLHGSDVWGNDPEDLIASGLPRLLTTTLDFPAVVLSPQAPEDVVWWGAELDLVRALLDHVQANYAVDPKRVYLTGLSMGGFGAWAMAVQQSQRFAALVPIAGGWDSERDIVPRNICDIQAMPIWVFHGAQDDIVLPKKAELLINALKRCGVEVRYTLYPDAKHRESFERAYADPELYNWMFAQHLP
ncbi:MAG TPA: prolyl oligopeptidase family serine peptidase [Anaerolineae bacterium]|nr:prolyl oligopeptidase family serine peptidase [Anaerolineae bacterium]